MEMYAELLEAEPLMLEESVEGWVMDKANTWRHHYESNYQQKHEEYYRLWRGIWANEDKTRESERSRLISPALQQAVESAVAEVEEATFGRGKWFDVRDDFDDPEKADVAALRQRLAADYDKVKVRKAIAECLLNAAIYGNGIGEIVLEERRVDAPATRPVLDGQLAAVGVQSTTRTFVRLLPIKPNNFLIDPVATNIDDALGVIIDHYVPTHQVKQLQEAGVYKQCHIGEAASEQALEADPELSAAPIDKVRITKYYGLIPRRLLDEVDESEELVKLYEDDESEYVEGVVVVANGGKLLKAERSPYMMKDRPVIAFSWDTTPSRFWGRGICEKGYNSQKALDTELRARVDALALTIHPMMAVDSSRIPRGHKPQIRPGKTLLSVGNPSEIYHPFNFGRVDQITFAQANELQKMVQQATGAVDSAGIAGNINGEATAAGISMSLGALIKRHKRTLLNFHENFLIPWIEKSAWRYMQFDPENYIAKDYKFSVTSTLGIIAREYEVTQLVQLLQTMSPDSPIYSALVEGIVDNMALTNREELLARIQKANQPTPEQQQAQQRQQQMAEETHAAQLRGLNAQAGKDEAQAQKAMEEAKYVGFEQKTRRISAVTNGMDSNDGDAEEFNRRMAIIDRKLKQRQVEIQERDSNVRMQQAQASRANDIEAALLERLGMAGG